MILTALRTGPAFLALCILLALPRAAYARTSAAPAPRSTSPASTQQRIGLFAPRVRRSSVTYLRLRLLELREAGLERARAAIERRLSIDELLAEPPARLPLGNERGRFERAQPTPTPK